MGIRYHFTSSRPDDSFFGKLSVAFLASRPWFGSNCGVNAMSQQQWLSQTLGRLAALAGEGRGFSCSLGIPGNTAQDTLWMKPCDQFSEIAPRARRGR